MGLALMTSVRLDLYMDYSKEIRAAGLSTLTISFLVGRAATLGPFYAKVRASTLAAVGIRHWTTHDAHSLWKSPTLLTIGYARGHHPYPWTFLFVVLPPPPPLFSESGEPVASPGGLRGYFGAAEQAR